MKIKNNKKGDLLGNFFSVFFTLVLFFALYPVINLMVNIGVDAHSSDPTLSFLFGAITFIILFGIIKFVLTTMGTSSNE